MKTNLFTKLHLFMLAILTFGATGDLMAQNMPLTLDKDHIQFIAAERSDTVTVSANKFTDWVVSFNKKDSTWLSATVTELTDNQSNQNIKLLIVKVKANGTNESRSATIKMDVTWTEGPTTYQDSKTITVVQARPRLSLSENGTVTISNAEQEFTFDVLGNVDYEYEVTGVIGDWLTPTSGTGETDGIKSAVTLKANPNTGAEREATVTVKGITEGDYKPTAEFNIKQQGQIYMLSVDPSELTFGQGGGELPFNITSNVSWTVESDKEWLTVGTTSGENSATVTLTASQSPEAGARTATVSVKWNDGTQDRTTAVSVTQIGTSLSLSVSPSELQFGQGGGDLTFNITSNVTWTVESDKEWLTVGTTSGENSAIVTLTATPSPEAKPRTATVSIKWNDGTQDRTTTVTVTQIGTSLSLSVSPSELQFGQGGGDLTFNITSNVTWTVESDKEWLTVGTTSGENSATVTLTATPNPDASTRTATANVKWNDGTQDRTTTITVTQIGTSLSLSVSPNELKFGQGGGDLTFNITSNVTWTVESDKEWLTVGTTGGENSATITLTATPNPDASTRTATVNVKWNDGTQDRITPVNVTQIGTSLSLSVSPNELMFGQGGGDLTFNITSNVTWTVESDKEWLTVGTTSGENSATITLTATPNPDASTRTATANVKWNDGTQDRITPVNVTQIGTSLSLSISPSELKFGQGGGDLTFNITSNVSWTVVCDQEWLTIDTPSGENSATVTLAALLNPDASTRTATVNVKWNDGTQDRITPVNVTQIGTSLSLSVSPSELKFGQGGGDLTFNITSNVSWTVVCDQEWLTIDTPSGENSATVTLAALLNPDASTRTATVNVKWNDGTQDRITPVNVTQIGTSLSLSVSPSELQFGQGGGDLTFNITSNVTWTVESDKEWLTVGTASGENSATVTLAAKPNPDAEIRNATVSVKWNDGTQDSITHVRVTQIGTSLSLTVSPSELTFSQGGGDLTFNITSNVGWTIECVQDWLSVGTVSGENSATVTVTVKPNSDSQRTATVLIKWNDGTEDKTTVIQVTQEGQGNGFNVTKDKILLGSDSSSDNFEVTVTGTVSWTATPSESWITISSGKEGTGTAAVKFQVSENTDSIQRKGSIIIKGGSIEKTVTIIQKIKFICPDNLQFSVANENQSFEVECNAQTWKYQISYPDGDDPWLGLVSGDGTITPIGTESQTGSRTQTIVLNATQNGKKLERKANIIVTIPNTDPLQSDTIKVTQAPYPDKPESLKLANFTTNVLEQTIGEEFQLSASVNDGNGFDSTDWEFTWDGIEKNGSATTFQPTEPQAYPVTLIMSYKTDPTINITYNFVIYPCPEKPSELIQKGNGTSHIMIATMNESEYMAKKACDFVFGVGNSDVWHETGNRRYYQFDEAEWADTTKWVRTKWEIEIPNSLQTRTCFSDKLEVLTPSSVKSDVISLTRGRLTAHIDNPMAADVTVVAITGKVHQTLHFDARTDFDEQIELGTLPAGLYIIKATIGDQRTEEKVIVK